MRRALVAGISVALVCGAFTTTPARADHPQVDPAFATQRYPLPVPARGVTVADLNGDGRNDIAAATSFFFSTEDFKLYVYLQRPDGTLDAPYSIPLGVRASYADASVEAADMDGDSFVDVVVATSSGPKIFYQRAGVLTEPVLIPLDGVLHAELADIDADGDIDMVANGIEGDVFTITNGGQAFSTNTVAEFRATEVEVADLSNDGLPDIAAATFDGLKVLVNQGAGAFATSTNESSEASAHSIGVGDVTGDGAGDVVAWTEDDVVGVYEVGPVGQLEPPTLYTVTDELSIAGVEVRDVNDDARADVVLGSWSGASSIMLQTPSGDLMRPCRADLDDIAGRKSLAVGDVNSDGRTDVVSVGGHYGHLSVGRQVAPKATVVLNDFEWYERVDVGVPLSLDGRVDVRGGCAPDHELSLQLLREGPGGATVIPVTTDRRGLFTVEDIVNEPGTYTYTATYAGEPGLPGGTSNAVSAPAKRVNHVTISPRRTTVDWGTTVSLRAHLENQDVANDILIIDGRDWCAGCQHVASGPMDDYGDFVVEVPARWTDTYSAQWEGDDEFWPAFTVRGALVRVRVWLQQRLAGQRSVEGRYFVYGRNDTVETSVEVKPFETGTVEYRLQRRAAGTWNLLGIRDDDLLRSISRVRYTGLGSGRYRIRAYSDGEDELFPNRTPWAYFRVMRS